MVDDTRTISEEYRDRLTFQVAGEYSQEGEEDIKPASSKKKKKERNHDKTILSLQRPEKEKHK